MPEQVFATKRFVKGLERLPDPLREQFHEKYPVFRANPHRPQLQTHKLGGHVGEGAAYSCKLGTASRFIWTDEFWPDPVMRLVDQQHDSVYRDMGRMPPVRRDQIRDLGELLRKPRKKQSLLSPHIEEVAVFTRAQRTEQPEVEVVPIDLQGNRTEEAEVERSASEPPPEPAEEVEELYRFSNDEFQSLLKGDIASWMLFVPPAHKDFVHRTLMVRRE